MDDILLISSFTDMEIKEYINKLQETFCLQLTNSYNKQAVNFLDMTIKTPK